MATFQFLPILAALTIGTQRQAVDLRQVERLLVNEVAYESKLPKYCLLVLGPDLKTRIWLVVDGANVFVDRNRNGDLTDPGEMVRMSIEGRWTRARAGMILEPSGQNRSIDLHIRDFDNASGKCNGLMIVLDGLKKLFVGFDPAHPFRFAHRPEQAPIVHVEGPLEIKLYGEPPTLIAGEEVELNIAIGTPGVGPGSFCAIQCCTVLDFRITPIAKILFPAAGTFLPPPPMIVPIGDD